MLFLNHKDTKALRGIKVLFIAMLLKNSYPPPTNPKHPTNHSSDHFLAILSNPKNRGSIILFSNFSPGLQLLLL